MVFNYNSNQKVITMVHRLGITAAQVTQGNREKGTGSLILSARHILDRTPYSIPDSSTSRNSTIPL
jgi:hypothetical protein